MGAHGVLLVHPGCDLHWAQPAQLRGAGWDPPPALGAEGVSALQWPRPSQDGSVCAVWCGHVSKCLPCDMVSEGWASTNMQRIESTSSCRCVDVHILVLIRMSLHVLYNLAVADFLVHTYVYALICCTVISQWFLVPIAHCNHTHDYRTWSTESQPCYWHQHETWLFQSCNHVMDFSVKCAIVKWLYQ